MKDFGRSDDPRVQAQLDRLSALSLPQGRFGLKTMSELMERLGNPHRELPPVFHVAGTNGKGSTCAFLRAMLEADGKTVHATISPHLVRYNERIRIAGKLIEDAPLADLLEEVLDAGEDLCPSFFEVTIAASFLAFSRTPADACVIEVGLGGRFDATNVIEKPAVCGIAALGIDHERFLLAPEGGVPQQPMARIAFEKAGIAKHSVPLVTMGSQYPDEAQIAIAEVANAVGALTYHFGDNGAWTANAGVNGKQLSYSDVRGGDFCVSSLGLKGNFQALNAGLAIAMLRHQKVVPISQEAMQAGAANARWPARLQRLAKGPLTQILPKARVLLDGGHNPDAARAIANYLEAIGADKIHAILGMLKAKNADAMISAIAPYLASLTAVPVSGHEYHELDDLAAKARTAGVPNAKTAASVGAALADIATREMQRPDSDYPRYDGLVLIAGSLYLAGEVLRLNHELPD